MANKIKVKETETREGGFGGYSTWTRVIEVTEVGPGQTQVPDDTPLKDWEKEN